MKVVYKPSMFNRIVKKDQSIVLYNSFGGTGSILHVSEDKVKRIVEWLSKEREYDNDNSDFQLLSQYGYLVPANFDEKNLRRFRYMQQVTTNRLHLVVHTTKACNFRCSYCYMDFEPEMMRPQIQQGVVNYIRKTIQKFKSVRISWFGGEPLLGMNVIENISKPVIDICRSQKKPYSSLITTNGYNLTPENIEKLISYHITHIAVTIDGNKELHDSQRPLADGSPTFERIVDNLKYIRDHVKSHTLTVSIRTNVTQKHMAQLDDYYRFFNDTFGSDHRFSLFIRPVADYGGIRVKSMKDFLVHDMHTVYDRISCLQDRIKFFPNFIDLEMGGYTCTARHLHKYTVGCDGAISKCDESLLEPIGQLYSNGYMEINEDEHAKWIIGVSRKECEDCFFSGSCFMELCPKARILNNCIKCPVNFAEIDSLILLAADTYTTRIL